MIYYSLVEKRLAYEFEDWGSIPDRQRNFYSAQQDMLWVPAGHLYIRCGRLSSDGQ
jgi:hypothetical protein